MSSDSMTAARGALCPHQREAACAVPHLEVVDDCSAQAGHGVEQAAVGDHKVDLLGLDA
jgi:hypothetical protein